MDAPLQAGGLEPLERLLDLVEGALPVRRVGDAEEREVKVLGVDMTKLRDRLSDLPRATAFRGMVRTWRIELPLLGEDRTLRYREKDGLPPTVDVKGERLPHPTYKVKREVSWELLEALSPEGVAERLGGVLTGPVEKARESYTISDGDVDVHLDIDQDPDLGLLVEIEGATDAAIERAIVLLHLEDYETSAASRSELLALEDASDLP